MAKSKATTVKQYLQALPKERRQAVSAVRELILEHLPHGYCESLNWGAICYEVPLEEYPETYNGQPLCYIALAAPKSYLALHLMCVYGDPKRQAWLKSEFKKAGKKLDMGKACLRFQKIEDLPLDVIAKLVAAVTPEQYVARCEAVRKK